MSTSIKTQSLARKLLLKISESISQENYEDSLDKLNKLYNKLSSKPESFTEVDEEEVKKLERDIASFTKNAVNWKDPNSIKAAFDKAHINLADYGFTVDKVKQYRDEKIEKYTDLAEIYARRIYDYLPPVLDLDELKSVAKAKLTELVSAYYGNPVLFARHYSKSTEDVKIGPFILKGSKDKNPLISPNDGRMTKAIKGAVLDYVRSTDTLTPHYRKKVNEIKSFVTKFMNENNRKPSIEEIHNETKIETELLKQYLNLMNLKSVAFDDSIQTMRGDNEGWKFKDGMGGFDPDNPELVVLRADILDKAARQVAQLNVLDKTILELFIYEGLSEEEITSLLQISDSQVSSSVNKSIEILTPKLKELFTDYNDNTTFIIEGVK